MSGLFALAFYAATPFWALMILAPGLRWTTRVVGSPWIVLPVLVVWAVAAGPVAGPLWALAVSPILVLTVLLSPVGLPLYLAVRKKKLTRVVTCTHAQRPRGGEGMNATTITCSHLAFRASARGSTALL